MKENQKEPQTSKGNVSGQKTPVSHSSQTNQRKETSPQKTTTASADREQGTRKREHDDRDHDHDYKNPSAKGTRENERK